MFNNVDKNGIHITFANGFLISIQWKYGNYCDNYRGGTAPSTTAECAYWNTIGKSGMLEWPEVGDTVIGHQTTDDVLKLMNFVASLKQE